MDRGELEGLDREALVVKAQAAGIRRARILTRPELIDELLRLDPTADDAQLRKSRGFFGRARDLVARVVERGLHLPDAADRIRELALGNVAVPIPRPEPQVMPTVTLAEIYAAQGHRDRAIETLRRVLEREPEHVAASVLLARLEDEGYVAPPPPLPPEAEIEPELQDADEDASEDEREDETWNASDDVTVSNGETLESAAETVEIPTAPRAIPGPRDVNGEVEFHLAPSSTRPPVIHVDLGSATRELPRGDAFGLARERGSRADDNVDVDASTDVFAVAPAVTEVDAPEVEECFAIPVERDVAGGRMYVRWSISWSTLGALLGLMPGGRFVVRAQVVTPAWDGPKTETRDLVVDPEAEHAMLIGLPEPSVVRVAVGWLDAAKPHPTFVPVAHSPALEMARGRGLVIWTTKGTVPVILDDPRVASIARAVHASRRAAQAHA